MPIAAKRHEMSVRWQRRWRSWSGPTGRDIIVMAVAFLGTLIDAGTNWDGGGWGWATVTLVCGGAGSIALWWRRTHPLLVFVLAAVLTLPSGASAPILLLLLTWSVHWRNRTLPVIAAVTLGCLLVPRPPLWRWLELGNVIACVVVIVILVLTGAYIGARRDLLASLRQRALEAEAERELRAEQARTAERARIAREMHDILAHKVSLIALQAGGLEVSTTAAPERVSELAGLIRTTAREALEDLRTVLGVLRNPQDQGDLAPQPDAGDIPRLVETSRRSGSQIELTIEPVDLLSELSDNMGRTAFRVVQESLTNVHKHARGAASRISVERADGLVVLTVTNERPVSAGTLLPGSGTGLFGLGERMTLLGGELTSGPTADGGWQVRATFPEVTEHDTGLTTTIATQGISTP